MNVTIKNQEDKDQVDWDSNQDNKERNVQSDLIDYEAEISYLSRFIQSHGVVLALQEPNLKIVQVSNNTESILGIKPKSLLNKHLRIIVPDHYINIISDRIKDGTENLFYRFKFKEKFRISKCFYNNLGQKYHHNFHGLIRRYNNNLILEIEPIKEDDQNSELDYYERLKRFINKIKLDYNFEEITQLIVQEIQNVTGYDRVLLLQFESDENGVVIAESRKSSIAESLLGFHFPSFDIPPYARQSLITNRVRLIVDINAEPSEIIPPFNPLTHEPLDLNSSTLKAVSPCHKKYYNNMGVSASLVISLMAKENLWGLIVCQNFSPKYVNPDTYNYCESVAQYVYLVLHKKQLQQINNYRQETNLIYNQIEQNLKQIIQTPKINTPLEFNLDFLEKEGKFTQNISSNQIKSIRNIIEENGESILQLVQAEGVAIYFGDELICMGNTPTVTQLNNLLHWFTDNYNQEIFSTSHLSEIYPPAQDFTDIASGLLAISIRLNLTSYYVFWFRPEVIQTVQWGGHPSPQYSLNQQGEMKLCPRNSFELWKETVEKKSLPWQEVEIEAARDLKNLLTLTALEFSQTALELAAEKAEIANQSKSQFLAKMSHELRTPLNAILGFCQIMNRENSLTDEQKKYLKIINRSGEHLLSLINDVLEMSRIEAGKITLNQNYFDLYQLIESIAEMLQLKTSAKNLQLILECDSHLPKYVISDENKLRQVLINLLENAIKFTKTGWVKLRVFPGLEATQVFFEVSDTGAGIAPEELGTLFEPFMQTETGRKSMQGSGLGLPIY